MEQNLHWKKISEELAYNGYRKIVRSLYELPDGRQEYFDVQEDGDAACVLVLTEDQKVVLVKQFRPGPDKVIIGLAGGMVDPNEDPAVAAARETLEETGYQGEIHFVGRAYKCGYSRAHPYHFVAVNCRKVQEPKPDQNEFFDVVLMNIDDFRAELKQGNLSDTITAYLGLDYLGIL